MENLEKDQYQQIASQLSGKSIWDCIEPFQTQPLNKVDKPQKGNCKQRGLYLYFFSTIKQYQGFSNEKLLPIKKYLLQHRRAPHSVNRFDFLKLCFVGHKFQVSQLLQKIWYKSRELKLQTFPSQQYKYYLNFTKKMSKVMMINSPQEAINQLYGNNNQYKSKRIEELNHFINKELKQIQKY